MEAKELRKLIADDLKEIGMKRKDYSLKIRKSGYCDTYVYCEIKNPHINIVKVENTLKKYIKIDRDEATCEILWGLNTFVHVKYTDDCFDEVSKQFEDLAAQKLEEAKMITNNHGLKAFENNRWSCWLFNVNGDVVVKVNDLAQKIIGSTKDLAILMFRMNEFQEDFL